MRVVGWLEEEAAGAIHVRPALVLDLDHAGLDRVEGRASMRVAGAKAGREQDRLCPYRDWPVGEAAEGAFAPERRCRLIVAAEKAIACYADDHSDGERGRDGERDTHRATEPSRAGRDRKSELRAS
ncbi:MAG: hypothetical protein ACRDLZ_04285 [Gaiellaceae bacterium]